MLCAEASGQKRLSACLAGKNLWKMYQDGQSGYVTDKENTKGVAVGEVVAITGCFLV